MGKLLHFEFRKLFRQKSFYICGAVFVSLILISIITLNAVLTFSDSMLESDGLSVALLDDSICNGLYMLMSAFTNGNFSVILSVFTTLFICSDYTTGTLKNMIARGYGRISIYAAKYIVTLCAATIYSIFGWLVSFLSGTAFWGIGTLPDGRGVGNILLTLLIQLVGIYAYTSLFFLISALLKKSGGAIALSILGPTIISTGISLIDALVQDKKITLSNYWLDTCFSQLEGLNVTSDTITRCIICFLIYIVFFTAAGHFIVRKSEV